MTETQQMLQLGYTRPVVGNQWIEIINFWVKATPVVSDNETTNNN
jgi:hypothetical protein